MASHEQQSASREPGSRSTMPSRSAPQSARHASAETLIERLRPMWSLFQSLHAAVQAALIIAVALIVCTSLWIYYSPYNSCMRDHNDNVYLCSKVAHG